MRPEDAWDSNPLRTAKRIKLLREAKNPDLKKKESNWSRKELLEAERRFNGN